VTIKGAIVVILDNTDRVLLGKRPGNIPCWMPGKWGFPGGKIEEGETPKEAAIRETKEEMNLDIEELRELKIGLDNPVAMYYTRKYSGNVQIDHEHTDWAWVDGSDLSGYDLTPDVAEIYDWVIKHER
jgi:8-oxo-dGTP diphosphatase